MSAMGRPSKTSTNVESTDAAVGAGRGIVLLLVLLAGLLVAAAPARAGVIQVTTRADETSPGDGSCSLREAISAVNSPQPGSDCTGAGGGSNIISLGPGIYRLSLPGPGEDSNAGGDLDIAGTVRNLTIAGVAEGVTTIDAAGLGDRVMDVASGASVSISDLTISGGRAPAGAPGGAGTAGGKGDSGGAIRNVGSLSLTRVVIGGNQAGAGGGHPDPNNGPAGPGGPGGDGGGIYNGGMLTLMDSEVIYDGAGSGAPGAGIAYDGGAGGAGGGIYNAGALTLTRSTVGADSAGDGGDGSASANGRAGNGNTGGWGGGVFNAAFSSLSATNSTLSSNLAGDGGRGGAGTGAGNGGNGGDGGNGGALAVALGGFASLGAVTVSDNLRGVGGAGGLVIGTGTRGADGQLGSGGGVFEQNTSCLGVCTRLQNSIVARNLGANCSGSINDGGHNLVFGDATCPGVDADPKLGPLRDNGGPTQTIALGAGSAAIDLIPPGAGCPSTDQRGVARPQGTGCDAGAYELAPPLISGATATATSPATATIKATVNSHLQDTTTVVHYGTTTAYGSTSGSQDGGAGNTPAPVGIPLSGLAPGATYHAQLVVTNADGTSRGADLVFTTPANRALMPVAPSLSEIRQSSRRWVEGNKQASISARHRLPVGTTFSFELNENATVKFVFTQRLAGRTVDGRCVARTRRNAHKPRCTRSVIGGTLAFSAHAGVNKVRFDGRLPRHHKLRPGTYTLVIVATDTAGRRSAPARLSFTILRRRA